MLYCRGLLLLEYTLRNAVAHTQQPLRLLWAESERIEHCKQPRVATLRHLVVEQLLDGIVLLGTAFLLASFARSGWHVMAMNVIFVMAGFGWATINVNSYPMVVELSRGGDVGKYTGFYYTASMAAQTVTPMLSGVFMEIKMKL